MTVSAVVRDASNVVLAGAPVTWSSTMVSIATVSSLGRLAAVANGTAVITARSGTASASLNAVVQQVPATITYGTSPLFLPAIGQKQLVTPTVSDARGFAIPNVALAWTSSNSAVVAVSGGATGAVRAVAIGSAVVSASPSPQPPGTSIALVIPVSVSANQQLLAIKSASTAGGNSSAQVTFYAAVPDKELLLNFSYGPSGFVLDNTTALNEWEAYGFQYQPIAANVISLARQACAVTYANFATLFTQLEGSVLPGTVSLAGVTQWCP